MADLKISQLNAGDPAQTNDEIPIARSGANYKITAGSISALPPTTAGANQVIYVDSAGTSLDGDSTFVYTAATGRLGIGTASPTDKLTVVGTANFSSTVNFGSAINLTANGAQVTTTYAGVTTSRFFTSTSGLNLSVDGAWPLIFTNNSTERMRLDGSGNLGLGVTPSAWAGKAFQIGNVTNIGWASIGYDANGKGFFATSAYNNSGSSWTYTATGFAATLYSGDSGAHKWFIAPSGTAGNAITFTQAMTLDSSGRLFINTTTGVGTEQTLIAFNSAGTYQQGMNFRDTNASADGANYIVFRRSDDTYIGNLRRNGTDNALRINGNSYLALASGDTERARITAAGDVGIGTTSPAAKLHVAAGSILIDNNRAISALDNAGTSESVLSVTTANNLTIASPTLSGSIQYAVRNASGIHQFFIGGTDRMRLDSSGRLLVGGTSAVVGSANGSIEVQNTAANQLSLARFSTSGEAAFFFNRSRGATVGTNTIVNDGDSLGSIYFRGANGTGYDAAAYILGAVDGTPGASADMPGRLVFATSADGSATPTERMRINNVGTTIVSADGTGQYATAAFGKTGIADNVATNIFTITGNSGSVYGFVEILYAIDDPANNIFAGRKVYRVFWNGTTFALNLIASEDYSTAPTFSGTGAGSVATIKIQFDSSSATYNANLAVRWVPINSSISNTSIAEA